MFYASLPSCEGLTNSSPFGDLNTQTEDDMAFAVKDADLFGMTEGQKESILNDLVAAAKAPRNGQALRIDARIRKYEIRYEMSSTELLRRLQANEQHETAEIADWLFWLGTRDNEDNEQARP